LKIIATSNESSIEEHQNYAIVSYSPVHSESHDSFKSSEQPPICKFSSANAYFMHLFTKIDQMRNDYYYNYDYIDPAFESFIPSLIDRAYEAYYNTSSCMRAWRQRALDLIHENKNNVNFVGHDATPTEVWSGLLSNIVIFVHDSLYMSVQIPGLSELTPKVRGSLIKKKFYEIHLLLSASLFINDECYYMLSNGIQYTRHWMNRLVGEHLTNLKFDFEYELNSFELSDRESALILIFVLTMIRPNEEELESQDQDQEDFSCYKSDDWSKIRVLNEHFKHVLLYEFRRNKRSSEFVDRIEQVRTKIIFF
jgi:hypothetical protein